MSYSYELIAIHYHTNFFTQAQENNRDAEYSSNSSSDEDLDQFWIRICQWYDDSGMTRMQYDALRTILLQEKKVELPCMRRRGEQLSKLTGLVAQEFDCCENSCMAFTGAHCNLAACIICSHPRWREHLASPPIAREFRTPFKVFIYVPLALRLQKQFQVRRRAQILQTYNSTWSNEYCTSNITDWWAGQRFRDLRSQGILTSNTDIALQLSLDGVGVVSKRGQHTACPVILLNNNIPPIDRFKKKNILLSLIIPGPNKHKDLDSFLHPLIAELLMLATGIQAFDAWRLQSFTLRAWLVIVSGLLFSLSL